MSLLERVVSLLERRHVRFALIGAAAMAAHGVSRSTSDIDLFTTDRRTLDRDVWTGTDAVDVRRGDADDPLAGVVRISGPDAAAIDIVVGRDAWQDRVLAAAGVATIEDVAVPVVDVAGLVLLKLFAGGPQDAWDIEQLLAVGDEHVVAAVERGLPDLPPASASLWKRIRADG